MDGISRTVMSMERLLSETASLQEDHVKRVCAGCAKPCCLRVHYLFNEKDTLFIRLSGRRRVWRRKSSTGKGCWFLGKNGCTLDPMSRPFICHTYICDELREEMDRSAPGLTARLAERFRAIGEMRSRLWGEYLDELPPAPEPRPRTRS